MEPSSSNEQSAKPEQATVSTSKICPLCKYVVQKSWYFCPNCSKKLKMKPLSTSVWRQIGVYLISSLIPPFGIFPAFNYLRQSTWKARTVGIICLLLTVLSIVLMTWYTEVLIKHVETQVDPALGALQNLESTN